MILRNPGRFQPLWIVLCHEKLHRHRLQDAEMVRAPAAEANEKDSFCRLHVLKQRVRHLRAA